MKQNAMRTFIKILPYLLCFFYIGIRLWMITVYGGDYYEAGMDSETGRNGALIAFNTAGIILQVVLTAVGALFILIGVLRHLHIHRKIVLHNRKPL